MTSPASPSRYPFLHDPTLTRISLYPGDHVVVSDSNSLLTTVLGSCIAVCLFDPQRRVCGMNHFMLSEASHRDDRLLHSEAGRYGVYAMELLINGLMQQGASRSQLRAKVFGGAALFGHQGATPQTSIGLLNVRFVEDFLRREGIPVIGQAVGGNQGRVIYFLSSSYSVYVRSIAHNRGQQLQSQETAYQRALRRLRAQADNSVTLWRD